MTKVMRLIRIFGDDGEWVDVSMDKEEAVIEIETSFNIKVVYPYDQARALASAITELLEEE